MKQTQIIELQRRIKIAEAALRSVVRALEKMQDDVEDDLADRIRHETRQAIARRDP